MLNTIELQILNFDLQFVIYTYFTGQLRGRVGRADKEAHAYLFYPDKSLLSDLALVRSILFHLALAISVIEIN